MKGRLGILMLSMCIFSAASALASSPPVADDTSVVVIETPQELVQPLTYTVGQTSPFEEVGLQPLCKVVLMAGPLIQRVHSITQQPLLAWNNRRAYLAPDYRRWGDINMIFQSYYSSYQLRRLWLQRSFNKRGSYQDQLLFFTYKPLRYTPTIPYYQIT